jgi:hypothetical protein
MNSTRVMLFQRALYIVLFIRFAAAVMANDKKIEQDQTDHLVPMDSHVEPAYIQLLSRTLFLSDADYARILVMPSTDEGECAIAIYSMQTQSTAGEASVTCTRATRNLWNLLLESQQTKAALPTVPVARTDAPIPISAAVAISKAVENMILASRPPNHTLEVLDGTDIRFSIERKGVPPLEGLLAPYARGPATETLHRIARLLINYCHSGPVERQRMAKELKTEATQLAEIAENRNKNPQ